MADPEHLAKLKEGVGAWNQWRLEEPYVDPDLHKADLRKFEFGDYNLDFVDMSGASLAEANFGFTDPALIPIRNEHSIASFAYANLTGAGLQRAKMALVNLSGSNLNNATFEEADLTEAILHRVSVINTEFKNSVFDCTVLTDVDLSRAIAVDRIYHAGPSSIGIDTVVKTLRSSGGNLTDGQKLFFMRAGISSVLLEYLPSIMQSDPIQFYTCFISYSTANEAFATRLNEDLNNAGVHTWKWDLNAVAGRDLRANIDGAIRHYDKIILVCSADSLTSGPVQREIERALQKEDRLKAAHAERAKEALQKGQEPPFEDTDVLVPIRIDDTIFKWQSQFTADVTKRYIPDFSGKTERRTSAYKAEVKKLIAALKPNAWPPNGVRLPE